MDFAPDARTVELQEQLLDFMDKVIYPAEPTFHEQVEASRGRNPWGRPPIMAELKQEAKSRGLWNLFLPHSEHGAGLTNLQYAPLAEILGHSAIASEALNCSAPDTGNMEVLAQFGTQAQQQEWLQPLLDGEIRSAFCMTEPDVASSDASNISLRISRDGDEYVLNGRKWWSTGALAPECKVLIVMGVTNPDAERYRRQSQVLVPRDAPGVEVVRGLSVFGYDDGWHGGHAEVRFTDVRVPVDNVLLGEGEGFRIAQERLGPGRIHHCMRTIGVTERALELACKRAVSRVTFGQPIARQGVVQEWIAQARIKIEMARLMVLKTAWLMDTVGNSGARVEISAIKVAIPEMATWILDRAIQIHGGAGVSQDFPLAQMYAGLRTLHLADGPDEVHVMSIARRELRPYLSTS
jgi:acyl-CoA dehydrogenase